MAAIVGLVVGLGGLALLCWLDSRGSRPRNVTVGTMHWWRELEWQRWEPQQHSTEQWDVRRDDTGPTGRRDVTPK